MSAPRGGAPGKDNYRQHWPNRRAKRKVAEANRTNSNSCTGGFLDIAAWLFPLGAYMRDPCKRFAWCQVFRSLDRL